MPEAASSDPGAAGAAIVLVIISVIAYWIPTVVAVTRRREIPNVGSIVVINLFLGWTIVGWVVALAMAVRTRTRPVLMVQVPLPEPPRDEPSR